MWGREELGSSHLLANLITALSWEIKAIKRPFSGLCLQSPPAMELPSTNQTLSLWVENLLGIDLHIQFNSVS
jgi:hypothetical protein